MLDITKTIQDIRGFDDPALDTNRIIVPGTSVDAFKIVMPDNITLIVKFQDQDGERVPEQWYFVGNTIADIVTSDMVDDETYETVVKYLLWKIYVGEI